MPNFRARCFWPSLSTLGRNRVRHHHLKSICSDLKRFLLATWLDIVVLVLLGIAIICVWIVPHAFTPRFPVTFFDGSGDIVWPQFAYPYVSPPLGSVATGLLCILIPITIILLAQIWLRSFTNAAYAVLGLLYAIVTGTLFQVVLKKTVGGLRPHFLTVCKPEFEKNGASLGTGYNNVMFTIDEVCRGARAKVNTAAESFPSGHSEVAWAGLGYAALYLFMHLQRPKRRPSMWRALVVLGPILFATYVSCSMVLSYNHHDYDVVVGGLIGATVALLSYWMMSENMAGFGSNDNPQPEGVEPARSDNQELEMGNIESSGNEQDQHSVLPR